MHIPKRVSTHSRPKAAGSMFQRFHIRRQCFNTQPPEGGWTRFTIVRSTIPKFQHTAARRRLGGKHGFACPSCAVSTHSRPKAAGYSSAPCRAFRLGFNTQPPEGGWLLQNVSHPRKMMFQHTAARRRLGQPMYVLYRAIASFNTQPPEGGWKYKGLTC